MWSSEDSEDSDSPFEPIKTIGIERHSQRVGSLLKELNSLKYHGLKEATFSEKLVGFIKHECNTVDCREFERYILPHFDGDLLSKCSTDQLDTLLTTAKTRGSWHMVYKVLKAGGSHEKRAWVITQACETCDYKNIENFILPHVKYDFLSHCGTEQLDTLLTTATTRRFWHMLNTLLKVGGSHLKRAWVVEQACDTCDYTDFVHYILPHIDYKFLLLCGTEQLNTLLTTATTRHFWALVNTLLKGKYSHEKRAWAVKQACETCDYKVFKSYILPHIDRNFLSDCSTEQLDTLLTTATTRRLWHMVNTLLKAKGSHEKCAYAIEQACETAEDRDFKNYILPHVDDNFLSHCSTELLDILLKTATTRGLWHMVDKVFKTADTHAKRVWVIEQVSKAADYTDVELYILPFVNMYFLSQSSTKQLDTLLTTATTRGLWHMVGQLLKVVDSHDKRVWVIQQACQTADRWNCYEFVLPYVDKDFLSLCSTEQLDTLLTTATTRGLWPVVNKVLKTVDCQKNLTIASARQKTRVIEEGLKTAGYWDFQRFVLPFVDSDVLSHCSTEQLDSLIATATSRCLWDMVQKVFKIVDSHAKRVRVIEQVSKTAGYDDIKWLILPHVDNDLLSQCSTEQLDTLLTTATTRGLWHMVNKVLEAGGSHEKRVWVIEEACETAHQDVFRLYIMSLVNKDLLSQFTTKQLDTLLTKATTRPLWHMVGKVLQTGGSHEKRAWVIEQACKTADRESFDLYLLPFVDNDFLSQCRTEQLDTLLTTATTRGLWHMVNKVLKVVDTHGNRAWVIEQARKTADQDSFRLNILPFVDNDFLSQCSAKQLETLLKTATTWGLWHTVHTLLETGCNHENRVWVIQQACKTADQDSFTLYLLPFVDDDFLSRCRTEQLDTLLTTATAQGLWHMVNKVLKVVDNHENRVLVIEQVSKTADLQSFERCMLSFVDDDFLSHCSRVQLDTFLTTAATRGLWHMAHIVLKAVDTHENCARVIEQACKTANQQTFKDFILLFINGDVLSHCSTEQLDTLLTAATTWGLWNVVHKVLLTRDNPEKCKWAIEEACKSLGYMDFKDYILPHCGKGQMEFALEQFVTRGEWECVVELLKRGISGKSKIKALSEACKGRTYTTVMGWIDLQLEDLGAKLLINYLPSNKLSADAKSVALRFALQQRRWDVISRACLSQVWEQVRRHLFREAVNQRQWTVVKKRADHTLYDDERWWALEEAYKQKQWNVMLQLADHGLTEIELMRVRYRLAKHADWDVVLRMIGRGVDVTELREVVESAAVSRKTAADEAKRHALALRWKELRQLEEKLTRLEENLARASARQFKLPSTAQQWNTVLFHLHRHPGTFTRASSHHQPRKTVGELLLQRATEQRRWHIVMHLVTLGIDTEKLNSLLTDMIRRRQWGVCRVLLKQSVSVQSCLNALPVFMEKNQWTLVARVMEFIQHDAFKHQVEQLALDTTVGSLVCQCVSAMCHYEMCAGDEVKLHVMHRAMERREGSVVGQCISTMQHYRLSGKEREIQFQQAIDRGVLQAVKPLVEEKEETEFQHRDATLLAAIEQRQWDVVDCCQLQGADIDMKDKRGETPLNREARNGEWKVVEELAVRGANPNVLDKDGCSVLNKAINAEQWDIVRLLIECLGNIHKSARYERDYELDYDSRYHSDSESDNESPLLSKGEVPTPLQLLIDKRQGEIIEHTLIWSPDQSKGVNDEGETTLHAVVLDKKPELLYHQIVRGVNPLELTKEGHSVLLYAVRNEHCSQKMVAECIRLGFSTHQPRLTLQTTVDVAKSVANCLPYYYYHSITSPFLLTVLRGMSVVAHMLYESGSCSYTELLQLYKTLADLSDPYSEEGRKLVKGPTRSAHLRQGDLVEYKHGHEIFITNVTTFLPALREMASTPRSLVSTCRIVISHSLTVHRRRERAVQDLDLTDRVKNYLLFSDLTDPDYPLFLHQRRKLAQYKRSNMKKEE